MPVMSVIVDTNARCCWQAVAGLLADARQLVDIARQESSQYRSYYGSPIPCKVFILLCYFSKSIV